MMGKADSAVKTVLPATSSRVVLRMRVSQICLPEAVVSWSSPSVQTEIGRPAVRSKQKVCHSPRRDLTRNS